MSYSSGENPDSKAGAGVGTSAAGANAILAADSVVKLTDEAGYLGDRLLPGYDRHRASRRRWQPRPYNARPLFSPCLSALFAVQ